MNTREEYNRVVTKVNMKSPVNTREVAVIIANNNGDLIRYLVDNDFRQVYRLLHEAPGIMMSVGRNASLIPDQERARGEMQAALAKKDWQDLNYVLSRFRINLQANNWTSNLRLIECMRDIELIKPEGNTYRFNVQFG